MSDLRDLLGYDFGDSGELEKRARALGRQREEFVELFGESLRVSEYEALEELCAQYNARIEDWKPEGDYLGIKVEDGHVVTIQTPIHVRPQNGRLDVPYFPQLQTLHCGGNELVELDLTQNPQLQTLYCRGNRLGELDLTQNPQLQKLN